MRMSEMLWIAISCIGLVSSGIGASTVWANDQKETPPAKVTYYRDVLPILQGQCQSCHRPGQIAPMSLMSYAEVRPWASSMKEKVIEKKMPPWPADRHYGSFINEHFLTPEEIHTIVTWASTGAAAGDPADAPPPVHFPDRWLIGKPDRTLKMPIPIQIPAAGALPYEYVVIPGGFTKDTWLQSVEVRPGNPEVVHHVTAFIRPPGSAWMKDVKPGVPFIPEDDNIGETGFEGIGHLYGYAPGLQPLVLKDSGKFVRAGSDIVLQLHYTPKGVATTDQTEIGIILWKEAPAHKLVTLTAPNTKLVIPPNDPNYEVDSEIEFLRPATLHTIMPHMHYRGKDAIFKVIFPNGEEKILLSVPKYDFSWQFAYELKEPLSMPAGTRIQCFVHFDNSPNNPYNPDPNKTVHWGPQTWDEMMQPVYLVMIGQTETSAGLVKRYEGLRDNAHSTGAQ